MKELLTEISITAPPDRIWHLLTDFASFPQWNPFIRRASGELSEGAGVLLFAGAGEDDSIPNPALGDRIRGIYDVSSANNLKGSFSGSYFLHDIHYRINIHSPIYPFTY